MMKAAIYCPGPSLGIASDEHQGLAICVNRASILRGCDYWACGDPGPILSSHQNVIGRPTLFTMRPTVEELGKSGFAWPGGMIEWESLFNFIPNMELPWTLYSMTAAMVLAAFKGAKEILIYGCDWTHEPDWDGNADSLMNREPHRWQLEQQIYRGLADELKRRGIEVNRIVA